MTAAATPARRFGGLSRGVLYVLLVSAFHLVTIRDGHDWGDDFSMYIRHAENLARGAPYAETGYIYNPHNPAVGPRTYPPGFPVVLAPIVTLFGRSLGPMKVLIVASVAGSLLLLLRLFRGVLPSPHLEALILIVGFSPVVWELKDRVLADLPFVFFVLASFACLTQADSPDAPVRRRVVYGILTGFFAYVAYATRVLGIVLVPTFLAHDLIRRRRVGLPAAAACAVFVLLAGVQYVVWLRDRSYFDQLAVTAASLGRNVVDYARALSDLWANGYSEGARRACFLAASGLAALGYAKAFRAGAGWREVFPVLIRTRSSSSASRERSRSSPGAGRRPPSARPTLACCGGTSRRSAPRMSPPARMSPTSTSRTSTDSSTATGATSASPGEAAVWPSTGSSKILASPSAGSYCGR